jgi:HipA N-terminal domain
MAKTLDVYLNRHLCGYLVQDAHGQMRFQYAQAWLGNPNAVPLSHSLPLREERFSSRECTSFYPGLSTKMAMKIGGEYAPDRIRPQHFDRLAEDAGLAKPLVKRRVQALAEMVLAKIPGVAAGHSKMSEFGDFIQGRVSLIHSRKW